MRVESVERGRGRPFLKHRHTAEVVCYKMQLPIELGNTPRSVSCRRSHLTDQKPALRNRVKIISDARLDRSCGEKKPGVPRIGNIEKEDTVLILENAQKPTAGEDFLIR